MNEVTFRSATMDDAASIARLVTQLGYPTERTDMEQRLRAFSHADYMTIVAEMSGQAVGLVGAYVGYALELNSRHAYLTGLVVDEGNRRQRIGRLLMEQIEGLLKERGVSTVSLTSGNHRSDAHEFYKSSGDQMTGLRFAKRL